MTVETKLPALFLEKAELECDFLKEPTESQFQMKCTHMAKAGTGEGSQKRWPLLQPGWKAGRAENALWPWLLPGSQRELSEVACVTQSCPSPFEVSSSQESLPTRKEMTTGNQHPSLLHCDPYFLPYFSLANISFPTIPSCSWHQSTLWALLSTLMYTVVGIRPRPGHTSTADCISSSLC